MFYTSLVRHEREEKIPARQPAPGPTISFLGSLVSPFFHFCRFLSSWWVSLRPTINGLGLFLWYPSSNDLLFHPVEWSWLSMLHSLMESTASVPFLSIEKMYLASCWILKWLDFPFSYFCNYKWVRGDSWNVWLPVKVISHASLLNLYPATLQCFLVLAEWWTMNDELPFGSDRVMNNQRWSSLAQTWRETVGDFKLVLVTSPRTKSTATILVLHRLHPRHEFALSQQHQ
jgi:hypothetical protein